MTAAQLADAIAGAFDNAFHDDSGTYSSARAHEESVEIIVAGKRYLFHVHEVREVRT